MSNTRSETALNFMISCIFLGTNKDIPISMLSGQKKTKPCEN